MIRPRSRSRPSAPMSAPPQLVVLLFLLSVLFHGAALGQTPPPPSAQRLISGVELAALYSLRTSLGLRARDWPRKSDPCAAAWAGVQCRGGRVVGLDLTGLRRTRVGRLDPRFAVDGLQNLTHLASLNASGFALPGTIPDWFGSRLPATLAVLDLRRCSVAGAVPSSLGSAIGLRELYLSGNALTGDIPAALGQLFNLTVLDLSGNVISGPVPPALGLLRSLKTLIISNNRLSGSVPSQLGDLSSLLSLDLSANSLSGTLSEDLKNLRSLQELDLGNNSLTGDLSGSLLSGLPRLQSLTLSRNNFSGKLPDSLWALSELRFLDVSYNNLTGRLPGGVANVNASAGVFNMSHNSYYGSLSSEKGSLLRRFSFVDISDNYFEGQTPFSSSGNVSFEFNCFGNQLNQRSVADCIQFYAARGLRYDGPVTPNTNSGRKSSRNLKYILAGVFGGLLLVAIVTAVLVFCMMRCGPVKDEQREISGIAAVSGGEAPPSGILVNLSAVGEHFTYEQLLQATSHFGESNLIKHGHSGDLYHGALEGGIPVVVKRIDVHMFKREAYAMELDFFAKASHARLVPLLGHCLDKENEKLLVYKYMPQGDLSNALYRKSGQEEEGLKSLDWITRLKIAIGVAEALCYLHHECYPPLVHRDIQASSVLLDDKFEVRLGSLSEVCTQEGDVHQNVITRFLQLSQTSEQGASGLGSATCAYDVYCLGKVLLELVTGKLGISGSNDAATNEWLERILPYINIHEKELVLKILDPSLVVDDDLLEEVWAMAIVGKSCLNPKPSKRPLVRYILKALENPLKVVREEFSNPAHLRTASSRGSWNTALFGSWRSSSDMVSVSGLTREGTSLKYSGTAGSQAGSNGEHSFSCRRPPKEICPEPSGGEHDIEAAY